MCLGSDSALVSVYWDCPYGNMPTDFACTIGFPITVLRAAFLVGLLQLHLRLASPRRQHRCSVVHNGPSICLVGYQPSFFVFSPSAAGWRFENFLRLWSFMKIAIICGVKECRLSLFIVGILTPWILRSSSKLCSFLQLVKRVSEDFSSCPLHYLVVKKAERVAAPH